MGFSREGIQVSARQVLVFARTICVPLDDDALRQPVLQTNRKNLLIERVEIDMEPSISVFEDELCRLINKDRMDKRKMLATTVTALVQDANNKVSIVERRLRVRSFFGNALGR